MVSLAGPVLGCVDGDLAARSVRYCGPCLARIALGLIKLSPVADLFHDDYVALKELCLDKLERMGLTGLRHHIVVEDFWTPYDIEARYASNCGSIYGVICDRRRNFAFKAPKQSARFRNLFFVGASVNPGAGMPMVSLSGQHVARMILDQVTSGGR